MLRELHGGFVFFKRVQLEMDVLAHNHFMMMSKDLWAQAALDGHLRQDTSS
jgi:hypothetical protein